MTAASFSAYYRLQDEIERHTMLGRFLRDLEDADISELIAATDLPENVLHETLGNVHRLYKWQGKCIDAAAKNFVDTWLAHDGGEAETASTLNAKRLI